MLTEVTCHFRKSGHLWHRCSWYLRCSFSPPILTCIDHDTLTETLHMGAHIRQRHPVFKDLVTLSVGGILWAALASPGSLLELQKAGSTPELLIQNLPFNRMPRWSASRLEFEKSSSSEFLCPNTFFFLFYSHSTRWFLFEIMCVGWSFDLQILFQEVKGKV